MNDPKIVEWLNSRDAVEWRTEKLANAHHGTGMFAEVKEDHHCESRERGSYCSPEIPLDFGESILSDIWNYGMNGIDKRKLWP